METQRHREHRECVTEDSVPSVPLCFLTMKSAGFANTNFGRLEYCEGEHWATSRDLRPE